MEKVGLLVNEDGKELKNGSKTPEIGSPTSQSILNKMHIYV